MFCTHSYRLMIALCLAVTACCVVTAEEPPRDSEVPVTHSHAIEGLWTGEWGGGGGDGVVMQPVVAELFIEGNQVEMCGFRNVDRLAGTVRIHAKTRQLKITSAAENDGQPISKAINYAYEIKGDELTLTDSDKMPISLRRIRVAHNPLADVEIELVTATGITDAGNLLVNKFTALRTGRSSTLHYQPWKQSLKTKQATILLMQKKGWKEVTIDQARDLICESKPVAVAYRDDARSTPQSFHTLWKEMGSPMPDSNAACRTFSRILRPGTLVFLLSTRENIPQP